MKKIKKSFILKNTICLLVVLSVLLSGCVYLKMNPPADVDKAGGSGIDNSCWMATASNMLAGAGYGNGANLQDRAEDIYADMVAEYGILHGGWIDTALTWWLGSSNNIWPSNPYQLVTVYGNKVIVPWSNPDGPMDIGNHLRDCNFVGLSISWIDDGGHAITCWGDDGVPNLPLSGNPSLVRVTDSDRDTGGDVQVYNWDSYTSPNPGGPNVGNGWYFDFSPTPNHPLLKHICVLSTVDLPGQHVQRVTGSYRIHQDRDEDATDLHYKVGTDTDILTYKTEVDWETKNPPDITETGINWEQLDVTWYFDDNPVPYCTWIEITTEFVLSYWNAIQYSDVYFTYEGDEGKFFPALNWKINTPEIKKPESIHDVTGGYVVGSFEVFDPEINDEVVGEYRFIHQYSYFQDPEVHKFYLSTDEPMGYKVKNIRFGHSYGYLDADELWDFGERQEWMTYIKGEYELDDEPLSFTINWDGELPYPTGDQ